MRRRILDARLGNVPLLLPSSLLILVHTEGCMVRERLELLFTPIKLGPILLGGKNKSQLRLCHLGHKWNSYAIIYFIVLVMKNPFKLSNYAPFMGFFFLPLGRGGEGPSKKREKQHYC